MTMAFGSRAKKASRNESRKGVLYAERKKMTLSLSILRSAPGICFHVCGASRVSGGMALARVSRISSRSRVSLKALSWSRHDSQYRRPPASR